jgi:flavin reductase ActVB
MRPPTASVQSAAHPLRPAGVSAEVFKSAMADLAMPVTIVTCYDEAGTARGLTASAVTSLSLNPPLLLVCLNRDSRTCEVLVDAKWFCVNVLRPGQEELAQHFASSGEHRFQQVPLRHGLAPSLDSTSLRITCAHHGIRDGGDHTILLGLVVGVGDDLTQARGGLLWYQRDFVHAQTRRPTR